MDYSIKLENIEYIFDGDTLRLFKECKNSNNKALSLKKDKRFSNRVVIFVANMCNAKCVYCYQTHHTNKLMTRQDADNAIKFLADNYDEIAEVHFFGGEPLLNYKIIKYIVEKLSNSIKVNKWKITSNIMLLNPRMINFFEKNNFGFMISLDGPKLIHDKLRKGCKFEVVDKNIKLLLKSKLRNNIEINCTYTKLHSKYIEKKELIDFFNNYGVKFFISKVETDIEDLEVEDNSIKEQIDSAIDGLINYTYQAIQNRYILDVLGALIFHKKKEKFCDDIGSAVSIDCDAKVYPCTKLNGVEDIDIKKIDDCNNKNNEVCNKCWARNFCSLCCIKIYYGEKEKVKNLNLCEQKKGYEYALYRILELYHYKRNLFDVVVDNYMKKITV